MTQPSKKAKVLSVKQSTALKTRPKLEVGPEGDKRLAEQLAKRSGLCLKGNNLAQQGLARCHTVSWQTIRECVSTYAESNGDKNATLALDRLIAAVTRGHRNSPVTASRDRFIAAKTKQKAPHEEVEAAAKELATKLFKTLNNLRLGQQSKNAVIQGHTDLPNYSNTLSDKTRLIHAFFPDVLVKEGAVISSDQKGTKLTKKCLAIHNALEGDPYELFRSATGSVFSIGTYEFVKGGGGK